MLAQARPLWGALPDGALKRQLLPELARLGRIELSDLSSLWGAGAAVAGNRWRTAAPPAMPALSQRRSNRRAPAASADLALKLLLKHSDWWERLNAEDHQLLHELGGEHAQVVAWLERQLIEHGPQTWATLEPLLAAEEDAWAANARGWAQAGAPDEEQGFDDLQRIVHRLWIDHLGEQARQLAAGGALERSDLDRLRSLHEQIARLKVSLSPTSG
jgi:DNA primase